MKYSNSINIGNIVSSFLDSCTTGGYDYTWNTYRDYTNPIENFDNFFKTLSFPSSSNIPNYPVSNLSVDSRGTFHLEIAVTNFSEDEIKVKRKGTKLIITGKKDNSNKIDTKSIWKNIAERDFELTYQCEDEVDMDKIEIYHSNGVLSFVMPLKEKEKPIDLEIKKHK